MDSNFYTKENLDLLKRKHLLFLILTMLFGILFFAIFFIFLFLATRENKEIMKVLGIVLSIVSICAFILFISISLDLSRKINQFKQIYQNEGVFIKGKYLGKKSYKVTLQDKSLVHEMSFLTDEGEKIYYLVSLFDYPLIKEETYTLTLVDEFIKEIHHEK